MKTGTTALGAYFSTASRAGILPKGVVYPTGDLWFPASGNITKHGQLADFLYPEGRHNSGRKTEIRTPEQVDAMVAHVAREATTRGGKDATVVFISETLEGRPHPELMAKLLTTHFAHVTVVVAVRFPVHAAQSLLVHQIKDWRSTQVEFDLYGMLREDDGTLSFNYARMIERWSAFPKVTLKLIPYFEDESDGYAVVDRFMTVVTGKPAPRLDDDFGSRRIHPSLPLRSLRRLVALKKLKLRLTSIPWLTSLVHKLFVRTLFTDREKVVRAGFGTRSAEAGDWVISDDERDKILALYGDLSRTLTSALGKEATNPEWRAWFQSVGM
ncbi:MAG: hypothetical protein RLZZ319_195 [Actinomycetota bacterium]|jgi:hypothetical protein